jgi:hypothetical protein
VDLTPYLNYAYRLCRGKRPCVYCIAYELCNVFYFLERMVYFGLFLTGAWQTGSSRGAFTTATVSPLFSAFISRRYRINVPREYPIARKSSEIFVQTFFLVDKTSKISFNFFAALDATSKKDNLLFLSTFFSFFLLILFGNCIFARSS